MPAIIDMAYPRRVRQSPELIWRYLRKWGTRFTPENAKRICEAHVRNDTSERVRQMTRSLPSLMEARIDLLLSPTFLPSQWPGLKRWDGQAPDQEWLAWEILGDVLTVVDAAAALRPASLDEANGAYGKLKELAVKFVQRRLSAAQHLSMDDRVMVREAMHAAMEAGFDRRQRPGERGFYVGRDPLEVYKLQVNDALRVESPWEYEPEVPSIGVQVLTQMRAKGYRKQSIRDELRKLGYDGDTAEVQQLASMPELAEEEWNPWERQQASQAALLAAALKAHITEGSGPPQAGGTDSPMPAESPRELIGALGNPDARRGWTQEEVDNQIRQARREHAGVYASLAERHARGDEDAAREAISLFGRNSIAKKYKIPKPMVSKSPPWRAMAAELGLGEKFNTKAVEDWHGCRHRPQVHIGSRPSDRGDPCRVRGVAVEVAAEVPGRDRA